MVIFHFFFTIYEFREEPAFLKTVHYKSLFEKSQLKMPNFGQWALEGAKNARRFLMRENGERVFPHDD